MVRFEVEITARMHRFPVDRHAEVGTSSRMPGNNVHGNGLPATFVPGRRNVYEGYRVANESLK